MADELPDAFAVGPVVGLPGGEATRFLRVDFSTAGEEDASQFESLIETKTTRLAWARATICPCKHINDQTKQPDPNCKTCGGVGWRYYRPASYVVDEKTIGAMDALQTAILTEMHGVVIRGFLTGLGVSPEIFHVLGKWAMGSASLTVRPKNRMGYYDRVCQLDVVEPFSEVVMVSGVSMKTRYPIHTVNFIASMTKEYDNTDVALLEDGVLTWRSGKKPPDKTRVTVSYMHHPVWVVIEYLNATRTSLQKFRTPTIQTPEGNTQHLPIRVLVRREYLPPPPRDEDGE